MFEDIYKRQTTIAEYRFSPMLDERLRYLSHCKQHGAPRFTLRTIAFNQLFLVKFLGLSNKTPQIDHTQVESAANEWAKPRPCRQRFATTKKVTDFVNCANGWLRFMGKLVEAPAPLFSYAYEMHKFEAWMRQECGSSEQTILYTCRVVKCLLLALEKRKVALDAADIEVIEQILADEQAESQRSAVTNRGYVSRLRIFFRFAAQQEWCASGIAEGLGIPRHYPKQTIPKGLDRDEVADLLATTEGNRASDLRARAILMLLITYGLRAGEVCALKLDDIDWHNDKFQVCCPKTGRNQCFPLSANVAQTLVRYVRDVRFCAVHRNVFLTLTAPCRPLNGKNINRIVTERMKKAGIKGKYRGAHSLRHAAAQHLVDKGFSMKAIGDYLGHRNVATTSIYAKVDLAALREIAETNLEILR